MVHISGDIENLDIFEAPPLIYLSGDIENLEILPPIHLSGDIENLEIIEAPIPPPVLNTSAMAKMMDVI